MSAWGNHFDSAIYSMKAGKPTAIEVGGAYTIEQCYELVKVYEETKTPFMMLENCCYGQKELMALNMARNGVFGKIVQCDGGYMHDLRSEIAWGNETRQYRFNEYLTRNCENYPTHEIGPISKILNINNGNRFESLVSMSSNSLGLNEYIKTQPELFSKYSDVKFKQGDIVNTLIRCSDGTTISIMLDTTLPRYYSRNFTVRGTKGMYEERTHSIFIDQEYSNEEIENWLPNFNNENKYQEKWEHPIWKSYIEAGVKEGHGGMDFLVVDAFFEALDKGLPMPIDVYDTVTVSSTVSIVSSDSSAVTSLTVSSGSTPVCVSEAICSSWGCSSSATSTSNSLKGSSSIRFLMNSSLL